MTATNIKPELLPFQSDFLTRDSTHLEEQKYSEKRNPLKHQESTGISWADVLKITFISQTSSSG